MPKKKKTSKNFSFNQNEVEMTSLLPLKKSQSMEEKKKEKKHHCGDGKYILQKWKQFVCFCLPN